MRNPNGKARRQIPAATKLQILKEGRQANTPISQVCEHHAISATQFYDWERIAERAALDALQGQKRGRKPLRPSEEALQSEVLRLREVIAALSSENLQLKRGL